MLLLVMWLGSAHPAVLLNNPNPGHVCVNEGVGCSQLQDLSAGLLSCTPVRDRVDCLKKMRDGEADFGYFEAEDLNMAINSFSDNFEAPIQISTGNEVKSVYLLVHNASNLDIKSVCHPGLNLQQYYPRALYRPVTSTSDEFLLDIQEQIEVLSKAWTTACIPGPWSPDPITDRKLKHEHPHLCSACFRQTCDANDPYAGAGALQCLLNHKADAAFVSDIDFLKARSQNSEVEHLSHYCRIGDGTILPLGDRTVNTGEPCDWGRRPLPVILSNTCEDDECVSMRDLWVKALTTHAKTVRELLDLPSDTQFKTLREPLTPSKIIKKAGYKFNSPVSQKPVRFCVHNEEELAKCQDLEMAAQAYGIGAGVGLGCPQDSNVSDCYSDMYFGNADIVTLDGGDVYQATKDYGFDRVLSEVYDVRAASPTSSYYAVAVVRADSNITSFIQLKGLKSCHTGLGKTAGWKMPVATLLDLGHIQPFHCDFVSAAAEFFSGGSCAPGAKLSSYNKQGNYIDRLCSLCVGEADDHCARSSDEPFYSYSGAFRCLVQGGGDVAFVKHTTVPHNTDGMSTADWTIGLRSENYKLLCPSGGTAAISEYQNCNLAQVPAHEVVVSGRMSEERKNHVRQVLLGASEVFRRESPGSKTFKLFGRYKSKSDLLFKDSAVGLRALSEDNPQEIRNKNKYFKKLDELHTCEVRVCALEGEMSDCQAMVEVMDVLGQKFVCISARDRLDCVRRVMRGQVDLTPLSGSYLGIDQDLRVIATARDPVFSQEDFRYKAVIVVRKATIEKIGDLRGKKSCHTGYRRTTGWRIPVALLKLEGVIQPSCHPHQSALEQELEGVARTFSKACVPGEWATSPTVDDALKQKYEELCSMCESRTCDRQDAYAGYKGALRCLTENGGDVAFSKINIVQDFFSQDRTVNVNEYALLCQEGHTVNIDSPEAANCSWAARPWDTYVTHGGASDAKVDDLFAALSRAKRKGEENIKQNKWYDTTLGIHDYFFDITPVISGNMQTGDYYAKTRMNIVESERMCDTRERKVRFCVTSNEEYKKCEDLSSMLKLRGISPDLQCVRGDDVNHCVTMISLNTADVVTLDDAQRFKAHFQYNLSDLLSENYGSTGNDLYYLLAVVKKNSGINSVSDLVNKTTCHTAQDSSASGYINQEIKNCLSVSSDFFHTYKDAFSCLVGSNKDVAFVKHAVHGDSGINEEMANVYLDPENFLLLCENGVLPVSSYNVMECNLGRVPTNMVVTRQSESSDRKEDMRHLLLKAAQYFGKSDSFYKLFYNYFSKSDLLFKDDTVKLIPVIDEHYKNFIMNMSLQACSLYHRTHKHTLIG